jgi:hypothetical protein
VREHDVGYEHGLGAQEAEKVQVDSNRAFQSNLGTLDG